MNILRFHRILPRLGPGAIALFGLGAAAALPAQAPEQRRALDAFRDSVTAITDPARLHQAESDLLAETRRSRSDPILHLRLGYVALQQGDLGVSSHFDEAGAEFKFATELAPQWPYAWFALGLAEYALGARAGGSRDLRPLLARDAWARASAAFARAAVLEPGLAPRLEEMVRRAAREHLPERAVVVREALRRAVQDAPGPRGARLLLALGRVERELGDAASLATFEGYLASGDDRGLALVELGRTRLSRGDLAGAADYYEGAASDDPVAVAEVRADLQTIASDAELADFDFRRGGARAEMVRRFWTLRDRVELRAEGERLAEHLRRVAVARRDFQVATADGQDRFDDRGRIFIRHGEPDERATYSQPGVEPNESWRYQRGGADMVFHFAARQAPNDFRLVESVLDVSDVRLGASGGRSESAGARAQAGEQLLRSRASLGPLYRDRGIGSPDQVADFLARERAVGRRSIQVGTRTDSYALRFEQELDAWGTVLLAGAAGSLPELQVLFAIPGYAVEPATGVAGVVYPVRVGFVALDSTGTIVAAVDSVLRIEPGDRIAANRSLTGRVAVPVRPGRLLVQAAVKYGDRAGTAFGVDSVFVPSAGSGVLALGDLLVGSHRGRLTVPFGGGPEFLLAQGGVVRRSDGLDLAVEAFGLAPDQVADVRVLLAPDDGTDTGSGAAGRWRTFPDRRATGTIVRQPGGGTIARWRETLGLTRLKPGPWLVAVVVTDRQGREARREARLEVQVP